MTDPATVGSIVATWKLLGSLYETYQDWAVRRRKSKEALELKAHAERLMRDINRAILAGASSDDPELVPMIREFRALIARDVKPSGYELTSGWIRKSGTAATRKPAGAKPKAKKPAAAKLAHKKPVGTGAARKTTPVKSARHKPKTESE